MLNGVLPSQFETGFYQFLVSKVGESYYLGGQGSWNSDPGIDCSGLVIEDLRDLGFNVLDQYVGDTDSGVDTGLIANVFSRLTPEPGGPNIAALIEEWDQWEEGQTKRRYCHIGFIVSSARTTFTPYVRKKGDEFLPYFSGMGVMYVTAMSRASYDGVVAIPVDHYFDSIASAPATELFAAGTERKVIIRYFSTSGMYSILQ